MTISTADNTPRISYTVNQGVTQTAFAVPFEFFADADLNVYVDGTKKTLATHYTTSANAQNNSAHVEGETGYIHTTTNNSVVGASGGSTVVITRDIVLSRTSDFPIAGAFNVKELNDELDRNIAVASDLNDLATRTIRLKDFDSPATLELPIVTDRADRFIKFDSSGNLTTSVTSDDGNVNLVSTDAGSTTAAPTLQLTRNGAVSNTVIGSTYHTQELGEITWHAQNDASELEEQGRVVGGLSYDTNGQEDFVFTVRGKMFGRTQDFLKIGNFTLDADLNGGQNTYDGGVHTGSGSQDSDSIYDLTTILGGRRIQYQFPKQLSSSANRGATATIMFPRGGVLDRQVTFPDFIGVNSSSYTVVGHNTTQTLTNKTLTSPVIAEITNISGNITLDANSDIVLDANNGNIIFKDDGISILNVANNSTDVEFTVSTADKNFKIKGTDGSSLITALDIDMQLAGKATFFGDVVVGGDLTVSGDTVTVNTATLSVEDPLIILAKSNNSSDVVDIGFYGLYDTSGSQDLYAGLFRDAGDGKWKLFKDLQVAPTTTVDTSETGYAVGTLVANVEATSITGTLQTAAQPNITSVGTITELNAYRVDINNSSNGLNLNMTCHPTDGSYIQNQIGDLYIQNFADDKDIRIQTDGGDGSGTSLYLLADGSTGETSLYYAASGSSSVKLTTKTTGIDVTGAITADGLTIGGDVTLQGDTYNVVWDKSADALEFADSAKAVFGTGDDMSIHWDGTDGHFTVAGTLNIDGSGETLAKFIDDGAVELYHNNTKKFETTTSGILVTHAIGGTIRLETQDSTINQGDRIGMITFSAPNEHEDDGNEIAAIIKAEADATFAEDNNQTDFVFSLGSSEAATEKMRLHHEGNLSLGVDTDVSAEIGRAHIGYIGYADYAGFSHIDSNGTSTYALLQGSDGTTLLNCASGTGTYLRIGNADVAYIGDLGLYLYAGKTLQFEGATADAHETILTVTDPTADRTITLPDATGTVLVQDSSNDVTIQANQEGSGVDPQLTLFKNDSDGTTGGVAAISFKGTNASGNPHNYAWIQATNNTNTAGSEEGKLQIKVAGSNSTYQNEAYAGTNGIEIDNDRTHVKGNLKVNGVVDSSERTLLVTTTVSNASSVDFNSTYITDTYNTYDVVFTNIHSASDNVAMRCRMGDSDSAITSTAYSYIGQMRGTRGSDSTETANYADNEETYMAVTPNDSDMYLGTGYTENFNCHLRFFNLREPNLAKGFEVISGAYRTSDSYWASWYQGIGFDHDNFGNPRNFITFFLSSGNIASGTVKLYGLNL